MLPDQDLYTSMLRMLETGWQGLPDKPAETPEATLRALWHCATGQPQSLEQAQRLPLPGLDIAMRQMLLELVQRRIEGQPLAYLTGRQQFMGLELYCSPAAMIPRKETEILARAAIELAVQLASTGAELRVVDLCTGSGNVALAVAARAPVSSVWGIDLSEEAVALARLNAERLGMQQRVQFRSGDLFAPLDAPEFADGFDLLLCNPPYISSAQVQALPREIRDFEPRLAFDGGPFGVGLLTRLCQNASAYLGPGGWFACEVGLGQGLQAARLVQKNRAFSACKTYNDDQGQVRVICAQKSAAPALAERMDEGAG